ncbi:MAG: PPC domain-containing protein [Pirellulales bacterium]|nr:PPC domain-containing protein [Pirellulales bacterium]
MHVRTACQAAALAAALQFSAAFVFAASPALGSISPWGAQRGTQVEIAFGGARLADTQEIVLYEPGIQVDSLQAEDGVVRAKLTIAPDCRLGQHGVRLRTASGISNLRTFSIGAMPELQETEPNSDYEAPQQIPLNVTVNGVVLSEDVDYFAVDCAKGQRLSVEIEGIRLGNVFFDPYVAIMDTKRFELSNADDSALVWQDGVASLVVPEDGRYIVQIRESSYGGDGNCMYRAHIGTYPRPTAVLPAGGKPGQTLEVRWLGDVLGERTENVKLPDVLLPNFTLTTQDGNGVSPSGLVFRLGNLDNALETEPNNGLGEATPVTAPIGIGGVIGAAGDVDCFKFHATAGQAFDVRVFARGLRSPLDPVLNVYRSGGAGIGGNDDSAGPDSYVRFTAPEEDDYVLVLNDHLGKGGVNYAYRIEVTPVTPLLTMGLPERQQFVDIVAQIPKGNRTSFLVSASRADFGGDLAISLAGLPAGVSAEIPSMPANQTIVPVLLTAADDAAMAGGLVDVVGRPTDANLQSVEGHLVQMTSLVRGQNNIHVWQHPTYRLATAVTEAAPFKLEIVQPQVPLVRDGNMNLKIVATRAEGFTAPISVYLLYAPSGVGAAGGIAIPEGQTEAVIPLNANGGAEVRTWKLPVLGEATVGNGTVLVSTQMADLTVTEPYLSFAFNGAAVEKGQETEVVIAVTKNKDFEGAATVELLGLPNEVTAEPIQITKDSTEAIFKVKTTANSPVGRHKTLLCRAVIMANGEPITHMLGTGELRIDEPLPPKADAAPQPAAAPMPEAAPMPMEKRLTRLEKLRLDREQAKKKAAEEPAPAEPPAPADPPAAPQ